MSAINLSAGSCRVHSKVTNKPTPSQGDLSQKASGSFRRAVPSHQQWSTTRSLLQLGRDSFGNRAVALQAVDKLQVDEQVKEKLRVTLGHLPPPRVKMDFPGNEGHPTLIVYRGMSLQRLAEITSKGSIGQEVDVNTTPPTEEEARTQVSDERQATLPEFTFDPQVARGFARWAFSRGGIGVVAVVAISGQYVTRGSGAEGGIVCKRGTPMELLAWEPGETITY